MARRSSAKHHEEEGASEAWLLPYSDLMTLLLAVFIVLYAVSKVDTEKAKAISDAFRGIFDSAGVSIIEEGMSGTDGIFDGAEAIIPQIVDTPTEQDVSEMYAQHDLDNLQTLQTELQTYFAHEKLDASITTYIDERGLVISLTNSILFDSGSADIKTESINLLTSIGEGANNLDNYIRVEGHTDNMPISNAIYPSNWELSSARASRVVRLFIEKAGVKADKLVAVGYGEYKPVADNNSTEGRAQNRRVDIIILNTKYNSLENPLGDAAKSN